MSTVEQQQQQQQINNSSNNNNNNNNSSDDQLNQDIKAEKEKEISYVIEASAADDKRTKFLAKQSEYKIIFDNDKVETFKRKPLSTRKNKEIDDLRSGWLANRNQWNQKVKLFGIEFDNPNDILDLAFKKTAEYCLGMTKEQFDNAIWEDDIEYMKNGIYGLRSVIAACLLRAVHGVAYFQQP